MRTVGSRGVAGWIRFEIMECKPNPLVTQTFESRNGISCMRTRHRTFQRFEISEFVILGVLTTRIRSQWSESPEVVSRDRI
jgi:hypothetical protein